MANKDRNKRAARKARQAKRQQAEATQAAQAAAIASDPKAAKAQEKAIKKADKAEAKKPAKAQPGKKPGFIQRTKTYFGDVRSEMRRVVWPSRTELKNFTLAVVALLVVFGVAVWLIDTGVVAALVGYSGLRG